MTVARYITEKLLPLFKQQRETGIGVVFVTPHGEAEEKLILKTYKDMMEFYKYPASDVLSGYLLISMGNTLVSFGVMSTATYNQKYAEDSEAFASMLVFRG